LAAQKLNSVRKDFRGNILTAAKDAQDHYLIHRHDESDRNAASITDDTQPPDRIVAYRTAFGEGLHSTDQSIDAADISFCDLGAGR
jgi:hypothetical protein